MNYYQKTILIPQVDENGRIVGRIERWRAHRQGIRHRGFTIILFFGNKVVCQHRKHPVFDDCLDFTASSHPIYQGQSLQTDEAAIIATLKREWGIKKEDLTTPIKLEKKIFYQNFDGRYTENEHCFFYSAKINKKPAFKTEFAYGRQMLTLDQINSLPPSKPPLAPWVKEFLKGLTKKK